MSMKYIKSNAMKLAIYNYKSCKLLKSKRIKNHLMTSDCDRVIERNLKIAQYLANRGY